MIRFKTKEKLIYVNGCAVPISEGFNLKKMNYTSAESFLKGVMDDIILKHPTIYPDSTFYINYQRDEIEFSYIPRQKLLWVNQKLIDEIESFNGFQPTKELILLWFEKYYGIKVDDYSTNDFNSPPGSYNYTLQESRINLKHKKCPDRITGDYPNGDWSRLVFDDKENIIYYEKSSGFWKTYEYDETGKLIYYEDSNGEKVGHRNQDVEINESRFNLKPKKVQDKIYGDYPDGKWEKMMYDNKGNIIYKENSNGSWEKWEYDNKGNKIDWETSNKFWVKWEYDENNNNISYENSNGGWVKREYNEKGKEIYKEDSNGNIVDNRPNINESRINLNVINYYYFDIHLCYYGYRSEPDEEYDCPEGRSIVVKIPSTEINFIHSDSDVLLSDDRRQEIINWAREHDYLTDPEDINDIDYIAEITPEEYYNYVKEINESHRINLRPIQKEFIQTVLEKYNVIGTGYKTSTYGIQYWLPIQAKEDLDEAGYDYYSVERVTNPDHPDYRKQMIKIDLFKGPGSGIEHIN